MNVRAALAPIALALLGLAVAQTSWVPRPFNGRNLDGWVAKSRPQGENLWKAAAAQLDPTEPGRFATKGGRDLVNDAPRYGASWDLYSTAVYGDQKIELEVMVPKGSNSGIYVMGEYEVQVLDSFGRDANPGPGDMGAIYGARPPRSPKYLAPGEWNRYEIQFRAPRFDASGKKTANARFVKVVLNGQVIHEDVEMSGPTPGGVDGREKPAGPIMFQGDHGPVAYRNLRISRLR